MSINLKMLSNKFKMIKDQSFLPLNMKSLFALNNEKLKLKCRSGGAYQKY